MTPESGEYDQPVEELKRWGRDPALNPLDALMWRTEKPPADSWTGVVVEILDTVPNWERFVTAHEWALSVVPRFAEKVVGPSLPTGPPLWSRDEHFDLSYHLRREALPAPGTMRRLLDFAQCHAVVPMDRNRPPWVVTLVEGLEGGRAAVVMQAHHMLMDGGGATQLFSRVMSAQRAPTRTLNPPHPITDGRPIVRPDEAAVQGISQLARSLSDSARRMSSVVAGVVSDPAAAARYVSSAVRVTTPKLRLVPDLFCGGSRTARRFDTLECSVADIKRAATSVSGTLNDAFVAAILGGLREYQLLQGEELVDIPISMPVSVRRSDDSMGGNRFTGAFFLAPAGTADPAARIRAMRERVSAVRDEPALDVMGALTPLLNYAPSPMVSAALKSLTSNAVLTTSSWPGLAEERYLAGARCDRMFVFGPLPGTSMCAALCSHVGTCCIAINVDGEVFTDIEALWHCLQTGLEEVLALGSRRP